EIAARDVVYELIADAQVQPEVQMELSEDPAQGRKGPRPC
ncbi:unnamed protein product, partial [Urochloa humidicola]